MDVRRYYQFKWDRSEKFSSVEKNSDKSASNEEKENILQSLYHPSTMAFNRHYQSKCDRSNKFSRVSQNRRDSVKRLLFQSTQRRKNEILL